MIKILDLSYLTILYLLFLKDLIVNFKYICMKEED